jgi:hypothetical protein
MINTLVPNDISEEKKIKVIALDLAVQHVVGANRVQSNGYIDSDGVIKIAKRFETFINQNESIQQ